jgi:hypothetical protein
MFWISGCAFRGLFRLAAMEFCLQIVMMDRAASPGLGFGRVGVWVVFGDGLGCFGLVVFGLTTGSMFEIQDHEFVTTSSGSSVVDERIGCDKSWMFGHPVLVRAF